MTTTETPIYEATLRDTGCDLQAIVDRPAWTMNGALSRTDKAEKTASVKKTAQKAGQSNSPKSRPTPNQKPAA